MKKFISIFIGMTLAAASANAQSAPLTLTETQNTSTIENPTWEGFRYTNTIGTLDALQTHTIKGLQVSRKAGVPQEFTTLSLNGYTYTCTAGEPALPMRIQQIELPQGATARVEILAEEYRDVNLAAAGYPAPLMPAQAPVSKNSKITPAFAYNADAYARGGFNNEALAEVVEQGTMRHLRIANLYIRPFRYNPATHTLRVYTRLDIRVVFEGADKARTQAVKQTYGTSAFAPVESYIANPLPALSAKALKPEVPVRYVIVSDPMFRDSLQKFIAWKTLFGYDIIEAYTDQPEVGNTAQSIHNYLRELYESADEDNPAPVFALFVGDLAQIPTIQYEGYYYAYEKEDIHYSDLYLCEFTGDRFPEMLYGRMSATTAAELMPQINKVMYMENIPYEKTSFLDTAFIVAGVDESYGESHLNPTVNYIHSLYMKDTLGRYAYKYSYPESGYRANNIINNINSGVSVGIYTAHGDWNEWYSPNITVNNVKTKMNNKNKYPLLVGNCCLTGKFDKPNCFGESLLRKEDGGAAAYIGCSNSSYFDEDVYWAVGNFTERFKDGMVLTYEKTGLGANDALYHTHGEDYDQWAIHGAEIMHTGNMAVEQHSTDLHDYYWQIYHFFGDPSYMPYTHRPEVMEPTFLPVLAIGSATYEISDVPAFTRAALTHEGVVYSVAVADKDGLIELPVSHLNIKGQYTLCLSAQNHLPYIEEISVDVPADKYAVVRGEILRNAAQETVQSVAYGQEYTLEYNIHNIGKENVSKILLKLRSKDENMTVIDSVFEYNAVVNAGEEVLLDHKFSFRVSPNVPDRHTLRYEVQIVLDDESEPAPASFRRACQAPVLRIVGFRIDDSLGKNPDGILDNGEEAKGILTLMNTGSVGADAVKLALSTDKDFIHITEADAHIEVAEIAVGSTAEVAFGIRADEGAREQVPYQIEVEAETRGRLSTMTADAYLQAKTESFETGDFSYLAWKNDRENPWTISDKKAHSGKYSALSGNIKDNGATALTLNLELSVDDEISFYYYVSSEIIGSTMGDFLKFYIDGNMEGRFAGTPEEWQQATYAVTAGKHTFKWEYTKDGSDKEGEDCVWIDDIRLPFGISLPSTSNESTSNESATVLCVVGQVRDRLLLEVRSDKACRGRLVLYDASGRMAGVLDNALQIDPSERRVSYPVGKLGAGLYFCVFEGSDGILRTVKFVKL